MRIAETFASHFATTWIARVATAIAAVWPVLAVTFVGMLGLLDLGRRRRRHRRSLAGPLWIRVAWNPTCAGPCRRRPPRVAPGPYADRNPVHRRPAGAEGELRLTRLPEGVGRSERIVTRLRAEGYELTRQHEGADLVIVNTCGFLDSAQAESLAAIGDALHANGKVIVTGCMGAEPEKITKAYPKVLAVTGPQQYESVVEAVHRAVPPRHDPFLDPVPPEGIKLTPRHYAYLKISEGCNNRCTFCIIPRLRGDLVSRPAADVLCEAERLVAAG